jgi:hypothetical protein
MMLDQRSRVDVVPIRTGRNRYKYPLPAFVHAPTSTNFFKTCRGVCNVFSWLVVLFGLVEGRI